jgi:hypothetical protein
LLLALCEALEDFFESPALCVALREAPDSCPPELWDGLLELDVFAADLPDEWR